MAQDDLYEQAVTELGSALERLAHSYEADPDKRRDLLQEIHLAIWRSLAAFRGDCSLRTWVYRVAHNVSATHVLKQRRGRPLVSLDELDSVAVDAQPSLERQLNVAQLHALIAQLEPFDREVIVLYLEGLDAASIAEVTGISAGNVATKIHRIKKILAGRFGRGGRDAH
jgi:RNA polymerase sigma-70 factor, ECF subfamily